MGVRLDDARANRDALGRQRSMAQEKLGRIDSAKMQRLRVGEGGVGGGHITTSVSPPT